MTSAQMSSDLSTLTLTYSKYVMFYNKSLAAPAPSGIMCFNDQEGDQCQIDWNTLPATTVQTRLNTVLGMLPPLQ